MTGGAALTPEQIDTELRQYDLTHRRFAEELYALDNHSARSFLRDEGLVGAAKAASERTSAALAALWSQFAALGAVVDRGKELRSRRTRIGEAESVELSMLLREEIVSLGADGLRPADTGEPVAERVTLAVLTSRMNEGVDEVKGVYGSVDAACAAVAERLASLAAAVDDASRLSELLELPRETSGPRSLPAMEAELARLRGTSLADPLDPGTLVLLDAFAARLTPFLESLAALDSLRTGLPETLLARRTAIAELAAAEKAAADATAVAQVKIAAVSIAPLRPQATVLRQRLGDLRRLAAAGKWRHLAEQLAEIDAAVAAAKAVADETAGTATALLERRAELRGRLKAYQMKASRVGAAESAEVTMRYENARALLWTAPCDLRAATRAVRDFQQALLATEETG